MTGQAAIGILGAGSWGTALAVQFAGSGHNARLWGRRPEIVEQMIRERRNPVYLPDALLSPRIAPTGELEDIAGCDPVFVVVPSHGFRDVLRRFFAVSSGGGAVNLVSATKGIETESLRRMSEVAEEEGEAAGRAVRFAVLSGPTFAAELAAGVPSAAVVASRDPELAPRLQRSLSGSTLRLYSSEDVSGVELAGAAKNVVAIAAGLVSGLGLGHNTLAALITRGLHEIKRLGLAYGGQEHTFSGLAGLGDLVLTCTGDLSRNRRTGMELAAGKSLEEIERQTSMVAEGIRNSLSISRLAQRAQIELPIVEKMMGIIYDGLPPRRAVEELMTRELKEEGEL